jgi:type I restriction enzyme S subunit
MVRSSIASSSTSNAQDNTNIARLRSLRIPIPSAEQQMRIVRQFDASEMATYRVSMVVHKSIDHLREFRSALITAAVTGQIDVATWGKRGTTDRQLDDIEAEMAVAASLEPEEMRA